uniref:histidine kinase n=1 Tax=Blastobotrys adeninivorans TaxID=409370 RepID=A0A060T425_BLAAD
MTEAKLPAPESPKSVDNWDLRRGSVASRIDLHASSHKSQFGSKLNLSSMQRPPNHAPTGSQYASQVPIPDACNLALELNRQCGFEPFIQNLIRVCENHFGAHRLSLCMPSDPTDIVNVPWGLKALWNKHRPLPRRPRFGGTTESHDDEWDTDVEDDGAGELDGNQDTHEVHERPTFNPKYVDEPARTEENGADKDEDDHQSRPPLSHSSSFKRKFSLTRKLSLSGRKKSSSSLFSKENTPELAPDVLTRLTPLQRPMPEPKPAPEPASAASTAQPQPSHPAPNVSSKQRQQRPRPHQHASIYDSSARHYNGSTSLVLFDQLRTLEWEDDPLIDVEGILNVLERDDVVVLQRKYSGPPTSAPNSNADVPPHHRDRNALFRDCEQVPASPWSRSPAPSPAIREYAESPFFRPVSGEMEEAFSDPDPKSTAFFNVDMNHPVDAIGFEDAYSVLHVLLVVPPDSTDSSSTRRSAPLAVLSIMSSIIPFPSQLRLVLAQLAPHIANALLQARAYSDLQNQLESALNRLSPRRAAHGRTPATSSQTNGHYQGARRSPYENLSPASSKSSVMSSSQTTAQDFASLRGRKFYSSLGEDSSLKDESLRPLEIIASDEKLATSPANTGRRRSSDPPKTSSPERRSMRRFAFRRRHVRPHLRKFLHSYGASFVLEPEKSPDRSERSLSTLNDGRDASWESLHKRMSSGASDRQGAPRPSNRLLRTMMDAIPVHVYTAEPIGGEVTWVSNRTLAYRGQLREEFVQDPASTIHPDERADFLDAWNSALRNGEPLARMVQVRRFDGRYRSFFMRAVPLRDEKGVVTHWFCTMMDIHSQRQAQLEAIQQAQQTAGDKYKTLAESTPIVVFTTHPATGVQYTNNKWFDYSGRTMEDTYGFQYINAIHPEDRDKGVIPFTMGGKPDDGRFAGKEFKDGIFSVEIRLMNKDGEYRWHLAMFTCSDSDNPADSVWFGSCTDIHDQKLIQQKLKEAKDAAQRTIESKSRFLSNMSHEIRTPLIGISGMISFLLDTPLTEEQLDYCHTISSSSEALLMVINDILDLSKVESGKMTLSYSWFDVRRLVEEVNELLSSMAISKSLELNYIIESDIPKLVKGDRIRLRQVMLNLIGNAIKFTDKGEIFTSYKILFQSGNKMQLECSVHDTGRGFTEEDAKRMFQPYTQLSTSGGQNPPGTASGVAGTGLGLVISRQLIQLHKGELTAKGKKGEGSTFTFTCEVLLPTETDKPTKQELIKVRGGKTQDGDKIHLSSQLRILVLCPYYYTTRSITHHILATVADPEKCDIETLSSVKEVDERKMDRSWTHVVVNFNQVDEIVAAIRAFSGNRVPELVILTTPTQRSEVMKQPLFVDDDSRPKITFLPKPLKPSRYSVVFDPGKERDESQDVKMESAHKSIDAQRSVFEELTRFAYGKNYYILLAEDNLVNQKVMYKFLSKAGFKCDVAADGVNCTDMMFSKGPGYYNLVLCDLDMPRKDGFETCEDIRKWEKLNKYKPIPIVALSAYVMSDMSERCDQVGFSRYISKPVEFSNLKNIIIEILSHD